MKMTKNFVIKTEPNGELLILKGNNVNIYITLLIIINPSFFINIKFLREKK
jgi:hypothetical protein